MASSLPKCQQRGIGLPARCGHLDGRMQTSTKNAEDEALNALNHGEDSRMPMTRSGRFIANGDNLK